MKINQFEIDLTQNKISTIYVICNQEKNKKCRKIYFNFILDTMSIIILIFF